MSITAALRRMGHVSGKLADRPYITMFDDITVSALPSGQDYAYGGYTGGHWPTFRQLQHAFPGHRLFSIAVSSGDDGDGLDIEKGDASIADAPGWYERQVARGVWRPGLYTSASNMAALERTMAAHHVERRAYRLWSAHYTHKAHLCSPRSCGYGLSEADGTQWTDRALGLPLDRSILLPDFFDGRPSPVPAPVPAPAGPSWEEVMMNAIPTLKQGDVDQPGKTPWVRLMQGNIVAHGHAHKIEAASSLVADGDFGIHTANALLAVQSFFGVAGDRICGPHTWKCLVTGEK
jgi:peptidoglycan hydrolase-like protein with peptidoglycan-binding domain